MNYPALMEDMDLDLLAALDVLLKEASVTGARLVVLP
jgi:hypothetical protein